MTELIEDPLPPLSTHPSRSRRPLVDIELDMLRGIRRHLGRPSLIKGAQVLSHFGEHAGGWVALGLVGAAVDRKRRRDWLVGTASVLAAHAAGVGVKRVVRRTRPQADDLPVLAGTPSRLSFPSAHACSTSAAAVAFAPMLGAPAGVGVTGVMAASRLLLGVHYPTDVLAGVAVGTGIAAVGRRFSRRGRERRAR
jgi:membrane-associated phospholipid phosphatase